MKFGIFYELQLPRPWAQGDEHRLYQNALDQIEMADRLGYDHAWQVEHLRKLGGKCSREQEGDEEQGSDVHGANACELEIHRSGFGEARRFTGCFGNWLSHFASASSSSRRRCASESARLRFSLKSFPRW